MCYHCLIVWSFEVSLRCIIYFSIFQGKMQASRPGVCCTVLRPLCSGCASSIKKSQLCFSRRSQRSRLLTQISKMLTALVMLSIYVFFRVNTMHQPQQQAVPTCNCSCNCSQLAIETASDCLSTVKIDNNSSNTNSLLDSRWPLERSAHSRHSGLGTPPFSASRLGLCDVFNSIYGHN